MGSIEKYKKYFTKEYLMGPNSFRLLDELIRRCTEDVMIAIPGLKERPQGELKQLFETWAEQYGLNNLFTRKFWVKLQYFYVRVNEIKASEY